MDRGRWRVRFAACGVLVGAVVLVAGLGGPAPAARGEVADADALPPTVAEMRRDMPGPDGSVLTLTALIDTTQADPDAAMDALAPGTSASTADVSAAYAAEKKWPASAIPVHVAYNPSFDPAGLDGESAMQWAMETWNSFPGQSFRFVQDGETATVSSLVCNMDASTDGVNSVRFTPGLPRGVLGATCRQSKGTVDGYGRLIEFDVRMASEIHWSLSTPTPRDAFDLYSVMLHELGHALGLDHTEVNGSVMVPSTRPGVEARAIAPDDAAGLRALYPAAGTPTPTVPPSPTPTPPPARGPLVAGFNMVAGPDGGDLAPADFLSCLPPRSWVGVYLWDTTAGRWRHYHANVPAYVNAAAHNGIITVPRGTGVFLEMNQVVSAPRLPESAADTCG